MLYGDIVIFGRDDTTKRKGTRRIRSPILACCGRLITMNKEEKAVVGINLRLIDAETARSDRNSGSARRIVAQEQGLRGRPWRCRRRCGRRRRRHDQLQLPADHHRRGDLERRHEHR